MYKEIYIINDHFNTYESHNSYQRDDFWSEIIFWLEIESFSDLRSLYVEFETTARSAISASGLKSQSDLR